MIETRQKSTIETHDVNWHYDVGLTIVWAQWQLANGKTTVGIIAIGGTSVGLTAIGMTTVGI